MKLITTILILMNILFFYSRKDDQIINYKEINLSNDVKVVIPFPKGYNENSTFQHIQIWISNKKIFEDTTKNEYLFDDKEWPKEITRPDGIHLVYLKIFDGPDLDKLYQYTFSNTKLLNADTLPYFDHPIKKIDGQTVYDGILHITEVPCDCDSCYYNPTLYYKVTENGILLDSSLTIKMNKIKWNGFYGFDTRFDIIKPCKLH